MADGPPFSVVNLPTHANRRRSLMDALLRFWQEILQLYMLHGAST